MLLRHIEIENFRGLRRASVDFDHTTALIGENSAGKTTLLDALAICLTGRDDRLVFETRDFHQEEGAAASDQLQISLTYEERDGEWAAHPRWAPFRPFVRSQGAGPRTIRLHVSARRDPPSDTVAAQWAFGDESAPPDASAPGLLAEWRRLNPVVRLRANRFVELNPRGEVDNGVAPGDVARVSTDPVAWREEQQIRRVYDRLTGSFDILPEELREGLDAAEAYLQAHAWRVRPPLATGPRGKGDLAETPLRAGRRREDLFPSIKEGTGVRGLAFVALIGAVLDAQRRHALTEDALPLILLEDAEAHLHPIALSAMWDLIATLPAQKIVTTNSGELLAVVPLRSIRRMVTDRLGTRVYSIDMDRYSVDDLRRIAYHVRINRAGALFSRCWLLVEGETEAWLLPELAQLCGYDLPAEGIRCVEFAQCGVRPLLKLANDLGIAWHLITDGDEAGQAYTAAATTFLRGRHAAAHVTTLDEPTIEHCMFKHGYEYVFRGLAGPLPTESRARRVRERAASLITRAIRGHTKPGVALALLEAANAAGGGKVPPQLRNVIDTAVRLARAEPT